MLLRLIPSNNWLRKSKLIIHIAKNVQRFGIAATVNRDVQSVICEEPIHNGGAAAVASSAVPKPQVVVAVGEVVLIPGLLQELQAGEPHRL
jgi:hypothetical protein